jgi:hypothetical protein
MVDPIVKNHLQIVFCKRHPIQVDFLVGFMTCTSSELEESKQLLKSEVRPLDTGDVRAGGLQIDKKTHWYDFLMHMNHACTSLELHDI